MRQLEANGRKVQVARLRKTVLIAVAVVLTLSPCMAQEPSATGKAGPIFVVRHAEKISENDDALSEIGKRRAECLARTLAGANVKTAITSEYKRTQETAAPAVKSGVESHAIKAGDFAAISKRAMEASKTGGVLIVGHSNTVPQIVKALAGADVKVESTDYDKLFVVMGGTVTELRFCPAE